jgi:UDP-N-acetylglucosamine 4-epimerase
MALNVLITGGAGFIGSNICEKLLTMEEVGVVRVVDNLISSSKENISHLLQHKKFEFVEGDIRDFDLCRDITKDITTILHQAALGSVPRSIKDPITTNDFNITGTLNIFSAARENQVKKTVFASSSSTYGSNQELPKQESKIGDPLSPYAVTKLVSELYAKVFSSLYDFHFIGFRYFNVFGPKQSPKGQYAAVIPLFFKEMMQGRSPVINGDGSQSRDFTYVENVVDINIGTLFNDNPGSWNQIYNVACGYKSSLNELYAHIAELTGFKGESVHGPDRMGDIKDSLADISKAVDLLKYKPIHTIKDGLRRTYEWYLNNQAFLNA